LQLPIAESDIEVSFYPSMPSSSLKNWTEVKKMFAMFRKLSSPPPPTPPPLPVITILVLHHV
jgi:hypothetical protein